MSPETADLNRQLRNLLVEKAYSSTELIPGRNTASAKIGELFEFLVKSPERVSPGYREHLDDTPPHRVVCDYIAGMTDSYLNRVHRELLA